MRAGKLRQRVDLKYFTVAEDATGAETKTWTTADTVYAAVEPLIGRELYSARAEHSEITYRVRIRFRHDVKSDWRVYYGNKIFEIVSKIDPREEHKELVLMCREFVDER